MLELKNISFIRDGRKILDNVNLKFDDNKFYVITGPNGSGKSTLSKIIAGIERPDLGKIIFNGQDITNLNISERANLGVSFAFQQPVKFKGITVKDLISLAAGGNIKFEEIKKYLSDVGLCAREYASREVNSSLSGGELKRIEIATVVARKSKLSIFDEPEAGIDLWSFSSLIKVFEDMQRNVDGSIIIISHQERILNIANEIILIEEGKVKEIGIKEKILPKLLTTTKRCRFKREECHD